MQVGYIHVLNEPTEFFTEESRFGPLNPPPGQPPFTNLRAPLLPCCQGPVNQGEVHTFTVSYNPTSHRTGFWVDSTWLGNSTFDPYQEAQTGNAAWSGPWWSQWSGEAHHFGDDVPGYAYSGPVVHVTDMRVQEDWRYNWSFQANLPALGYQVPGSIRYATGPVSGRAFDFGTKG